MFFSGKSQPSFVENFFEFAAFKKIKKTILFKTVFLILIFRCAPVRLRFG